MTKDEMHTVLSEHFARFCTWPCSRLAVWVDPDRTEHGCLEHVEGTGSDGTPYQMEFNVFWDDRPRGDIRICGDLSAEPQRRLLGLLPIHMPHVTDSSIMGPDGRFVGEHEPQLAEPLIPEGRR